MCFILILTLVLTVQWLDLPIGNVIRSLELPESQYINKNLPEFHLEELATLDMSIMHDATLLRFVHNRLDRVCHTDLAIF